MVGENFQIYMILFTGKIFYETRPTLHLAWIWHYSPHVETPPSPHKLTQKGLISPMKKLLLEKNSPIYFR